ncbi:hypothetical protein [Streptomyces erythrochromogenes]|uniref:hypothetical protein n=1 Tax=Streptomyces erythrochromogenes TaxID=285574 RepID=UPI00369FDDE0
MPGQTKIPGAEPYDTIATGKAKKSELMVCAYVLVADCYDAKQITGWAANVAAEACTPTGTSPGRP